MTATNLLAFVSGAALGLAIGLAYFAALRVNVRLYISGSAGWRPVLLHVARIVAVALGFWALATQGPGPLLGGLLGFLAARRVIRKWGVEPS